LNSSVPLSHLLFALVRPVVRTAPCTVPRVENCAASWSF
jgi:hypothetical protein